MDNELDKMWYCECNGIEWCDIRQGEKIIGRWLTRKCEYINVKIV